MRDNVDFWSYIRSLAVSCKLVMGLLDAEQGGPYLLQAIGESVAHARPAKAGGAHVQHMVVGWDFMPEEVLQVGVLWAPHKLLQHPSASLDK